MHIVPALPDALESVMAQEEAAHGETRLAARSDAYFFTPHQTIVAVQLHTSLGDQSPPSMVWDDEQGAYWEFLLEPKAVTAIGEGGKLELSLSVTDKDKMEAHIRRGLRAGSSAGGLRSFKGEELPNGRITIDPVVHKFPPPSAPKDPELKSRTSTSITFAWKV